MQRGRDDISTKKIMRETFLDQIVCTVDAGMQETIQVIKTHQQQRTVGIVR